MSFLIPKLLLACLLATFAQPIRFTVPGDPVWVTIGEPYTITWEDAVGLVTISLLIEVKLVGTNRWDPAGTIIDGWTDQSYTWNDDVPDRNTLKTYAFQVGDQSNTSTDLVRVRFVTGSKPLFSTVASATSSSTPVASAPSSTTVQGPPGTISTPISESAPSISSTSSQVSPTSSSSSSGTTTPAPSVPTSTEGGGGGGGGGLPTGAKAAIGVVIPLALIVLIALFIILRKKRKARKSVEEGESSGVAQLHGDSRRFPELAGDDTQFPQEVGGNEIGEKKNDVTYTTSGAEEKQELDASNDVVRTDASELPDQTAQATLAGLPTFELSDNKISEIGAGASTMSRIEMPDSPISPNSRLHRKEEAPVEQPAAPSQASDTPIVNPKVAERLELERRRKGIAAEKEHILRLRKLQEEEDAIEHRLRHL